MLDAVGRRNTEQQAKMAAEKQTLTEQSRRAIRHYDVSGPDITVLAATINKQTASRNVMIPLLAKQLQSSDVDSDLNEVFLKTTDDVRAEVPRQVPEYRSTMRYKICLKKVFRKDKVYKSEVMPSGEEKQGTVKQKKWQNRK